MFQRRIEEQFNYPALPRSVLCEVTKDRLGEDSQIQWNLGDGVSATHGRVMGQERELGATKIAEFQVLSDAAGNICREVVAAKRKQGRRGGTSGRLPEY